MIREFCKNINFMKVQPNRNIYPNVEDRTFWNSVAIEFGTELEEIRKKIEATPRTFLTASMYLEHSIKGNYANYYAEENGRRYELMVKCLLECCYNDGRYLFDIIDMVWMILEETTWTYPPHNKFVDTADGLPDYERHSLDLGIVNTADILAFVYRVLGKKLDAISKVVTRRIQGVIKKVLFQDFLARDDYWWMGMLGPDRSLNNWCPWIASYTLRCAHILEDDLSVFRKIVLKTVYMIDAYLDKYPDDGACDEGANYWRQAVGNVIEGIESLNLATNNGFCEVFTNKKIRRMGEVYSDYHIDQNVFVNFGDAGSLLNIDVWTYYHYGKLLKSEKMCNFAVSRYKEQCGTKYLLDDLKNLYINPLRFVNMFKYDDELKGGTINSALYENHSYYPSMHFLAIKPNEYNDKFLAFKGCHNRQSHNHNDVGGFMVHKDGVRYLIDPGKRSYDKDSFSEKRYTIWANRSEYHNLPIINGYGQMNGIEYAATDVEYCETDTAISLSMNIKEAYENRDEVNKWVRTIKYSLISNEIIVTEDFDFVKEFDYELCFMTPQRAAYENGVLTLRETDGKKLQLIFKDVDFEFRLEELQMDDPLLNSIWGDYLYRVHLCNRAKVGKIVYYIK